MLAYREQAQHRSPQGSSWHSAQVSGLSLNWYEDVNDMRQWTTFRRPSLDRCHACPA